MKSVTFLGFYTVEFIEYELGCPGGEIWTMNDWYTHFSLTRPNRIYNPWTQEFANNWHEFQYKEDWMERYNFSGAEVVVLEKIPGVERQREFDIARADRDFNLDWFTSTIAYMMADAIWEGYDLINMMGIRLMLRDEYKQQVPGLLELIDIAERKGARVNCRYLDEWRARKEHPETIGWYTHGNADPEELRKRLVDTPSVNE